MDIRHLEKKSIDLRTQRYGKFLVAKRIKIAHIINPVKVDNGNSSYLDIAQPITFRSMLRAKKYAKKKGIEVELFTVQFSNTDSSIVPRGFSILPNLDKSIKDYHKFENKIKTLPRIRDIIDALYENSEAEYFIYTNVDIGLQENFYVKVRNLIEKGHDALCINRRDIPKRLNNKVLRAKDLDIIYNLKGEKHPGRDTFIFKRSIVPNLKLKNVFIGLPPVGLVLFTQIKRNSNNMLYIRDGCRKKFTFHMGSDRSWKNSKNSEAHRYNKEQARDLI